MTRFGLFVALGGAVAVTTAGTAQAPTPAIQAVLDSIRTAHADLPGIAIHIEAPRRRLSWTGTTGVAAGSKQPLTARHGHRIASNTKTYVAAAILRLWEQGRLGLDDPIRRHLPSRYLALLEADGYQVDEITVRHLLSHTSGIYDWGTDSAYGARVTAEPKHRWSRMEQVRFAMDHGAPYGAPGEVYHYSDTGYILLGEIIERRAGQPLGPAMRRLLRYQANGFTATWLESLEPKPAAVSDRAHQFQGPTDTYEFDPSLDLWGGGGLAMTMKDLARFNRALFTGGVYQNPTTIDSMLTKVPARRLTGYRLGIVETSLLGYRAYGHTGYWNTFAYYLPDLDLSIAGSLLQNARYDVAQEVLRAVLERLEPGRTALLGRLSAAAAKAASTPGVPAAIAYLESPRMGLHFGTASGWSELNATKARSDQPVRIASNTKTYTAAAILRLVEGGKVAIDEPIGRHLSDESRSLLTGGGYDPGAMTIRQVLQHVAGLYDHGSDSGYVAAVLANPSRRWTRRDQLEWATTRGRPVGKPGERFRYSDTGYILLGEVIERVTGRSMAAAFRDLLAFDRLGLDRTWVETIDPDPWFADQRAHQYFGTTDTYEHDPSFDLFGGGGLAATTRDMALFTRAVMTNRVFDRTETLQLMLTPPTAVADRDYRMGIYRRVAAGVEGFGHTGFWGTFSFYFPSLDLAVAGTVTQQQAGRTLGAMLDELVAAAKEAAAAP
ncbi:MAG: serine hydrolase domain-containing protein [Gemmatimonadales bacterium]